MKVKGKNLFHPVRLALTGEMSGQDVTKQLALLTLAMLERAGIAPTVVLYLDTPLDVAQLRALISAMNVRVREAMRTKESLYSEQDMDGAQWTDEALLLQIAKHPILLNRPVVQSPLGVKLCRPSEAVLALLTPQQQRQLGAFTKEDGQLVPPTQ